MPFGIDRQTEAASSIGGMRAHIALPTLIVSFSRRHDMQATPSIPAPAIAQRASVYWLLVPVALIAAATAWSPTSPPTVESAIAPPPVVAAGPAATGDTSVPNASQVSFKDDGLEEPAPTF
jgi:hypothetical protein